MYTENRLQTIVVGCLVRNEKQEVLLIRHHKRGWEIPQGRVEEGEDLITALQREVREESGVEIEPGPLAAIWSKLSPPAALILTFLGRYKSGVLTASDDSLEAAWIQEAEALAMIENPIMRDRFISLLEFSGMPIYRAYSTGPYQVHVEKELGNTP